MAKPSLRVGVAYDFRNPPESGMSHPRLYAAIIDQAAWLDGLGLDGNNGRHRRLLAMARDAPALHVSFMINFADGFAVPRKPGNSAF